MALKRIYCSSCGLEILPDETFVIEQYNDVYHGAPYICYPYRDMGVF